MQLNTDTFETALFELIRTTACELPQDVEQALRRAHEAEIPGSNPEMTLALFLQNIEMAKARKVPLCQDTGTPIVHIHHPVGVSPRRLTSSIQAALAKATKHQFLRPNAVDPVTGHNSGNNVGQGFPQIFFTEEDAPHLVIGLMLKGGGCENVGRQYSLPHVELHAGRDLEGVRRIVLDAVRQAEGKGCPPGILGVCIGGDRGSGYIESKTQLFRPLDDVNPIPVLAALENRILTEANQLGIGPLGLGGNSTLLGVKIGTQHRLPASFFVTISYMCWEHRRRWLLHGVGGAGAYNAAAVAEVIERFKAQEFGLPEAFWKIRLDRFQGIVTMDAHGNSLHADLAKEVDQNVTTFISTTVRF